MKNLSETLAKGLGTTFLLGLFSLSAWAQTNQCATIDCDCDSLMRGNDQALCVKQQATLRKDCKLAGGYTGYCRVAGLNAHPLPFATETSGVLIEHSDELEANLEQTEALFWSADQDLATGVKYQNRSAYGNALTAYKNLAATLNKIYQFQRQAYNSYQAIDEQGDADDVATDAWQPLSKWGQKLYVQARSLWADKPESEPKLQRKRQVLAMNVMRYANSTLQQAGEMAALADEPEQAARLWRMVAENAELMVSWRTQTRSKAQYINYFTQQGVAAWFRSALYYDQLEETELASEARLKADQLSKTNVASR